MEIDFVLVVKLCKISSLFFFFLFVCEIIKRKLCELRKFSSLSIYENSLNVYISFHKVNSEQRRNH